MTGPQPFGPFGSRENMRAFTASLNKLAARMDRSATYGGADTYDGEWVPEEADYRPIPISRPRSRQSRRA